MIPFHQSTKNSKLTSFLLSKHLSNKTGNFSLPTTSGNTKSLSNRCNVVMANPFPKILSVLSVVLLILTFMTTMVVMVSTNVRSVVRLFVMLKLSQHRSDLPVLIVAILLSQRKNVNVSVSINVSIQTVLIIFTT